MNNNESIDVQIHDYIFVDRVPMIEEYQTLHMMAGRKVLDRNVLEARLRNSLFSVCVIHESVLLGCGRVVEFDGMLYEDIVVTPEPRHHKLCEYLTNRVFEFIHKLNGQRQHNEMNRIDYDDFGMFLMWAKYNLA